MDSVPKARNFAPEAHTKVPPLCCHPSSMSLRRLRQAQAVDATAAVRECDVTPHRPDWRMSRFVQAGQTRTPAQLGAMRLFQNVAVSLCKAENMKGRHRRPNH